MLGRGHSLVTLARDFVALTATVSGFVFYWGYLGLQTPFQTKFGVTLPFPAQDYWLAGLPYLGTAGVLTVIGLSLGLLVVARPWGSRWFRDSLILAGVSASVLKLVYSSDWLPATAGVICVASAVAVTAWAMGIIAGHLIRILEQTSTALRQWELGESILQKQTEQLTDRLNDPRILALRARVGDPLAAAAAEGQLSPQAERIDVAKQIFSDGNNAREKIALHIAGYAITAAALIGWQLGTTYDFVRMSNVQTKLSEHYPAVTILTKSAVPEFGSISSGAVFISKALYILRTDGQLYAVSQDESQLSVVPSTDVIRVVSSRKDSVSSSN